MSKLIVPRRSLAAGQRRRRAGAGRRLRRPADLGKPAPAFTAADSNGKTWSLAELKGKVVVLETTNQDCPYVRKHYNSSNMQTQQREAAAKGVVWLTVASSAPGEQGFVTAAQANELTKTPQRRAGRLPARSAKQDRARLRRHGDAAHVHHRCLGHAGLQGRHRFDPVVRASPTCRRPSSMCVSALDEVLAGKPVSEASTRPYGCTLKYAQQRRPDRSRAMPHDGWHPHDHPHEHHGHARPCPTDAAAGAGRRDASCRSAAPVRRRVDAAQRIADAANRFLGLLDDAPAQAGADRLRVRQPARLALHPAQPVRA